MLFAALPAAAALPEPVYEIRIEARFDPEQDRIAGVERLRWRNGSTAPVDELRFHLYLNAFANNRSTFMRESAGRLRGVEMPEDDWGWIEVRSMRLPDGRDLAAGEEFVAPDDGNLDDRTVARYPLPEPLEPGAWIDLEIDFESQLPGVFARTGVHGDYVLAGQWYPKIGVFEEAGRRGRAAAGWNCHQFHADSEFYADFGDYEVTLTLPERYRGRIAATGRLVEESVQDGEVTVRFAQRGVHDFAWGADPRFHRVESRFDPERDVPEDQRLRIAETLGINAGELRLEPVELKLFLQPAHRGQAERYLRAARAALAGLGLRLGAYPYDTLTLVDPPRGAMGSAGMEYPTFITVGTHPIFSWPPFRNVRLPEAVTVHEVGHQFWQGIVASNEFEESWLDEGINTYYEVLIMEEAYGDTGMKVLGMERSTFERRRSRLAGGGFTDPVVQPAWTFRSSSSYGLNSFSRPAVTLRHLEGVLGPGPFHRAMRHYFEAWKFRHPTTADFERAIGESTGEDLEWFFDQALRTDRSLDYAILSASSVEIEAPAGFFWDEGERRLMPPPDESGVQENGDREGEGSETLFRIDVVAVREGEFVHPVTLELVYADGESERHDWDGASRWRRWSFDRPSELESASIDPDEVLVLDVDRTNNSRRLEADRTPVDKMLSHLVFWLQNLFEAVSLFG